MLVLTVTTACLIFLGTALVMAVLFSLPLQMQNWYHYSCFFKTNSTVGSVDDIDGFETLRWDDQQKIKERLQGGESTDGGDTSVGKKKKNPTLIRSDLQVEYAKSGKSSCRACLSLIEKVRAYRLGHLLD